MIFDFRGIRNAISVKGLSSYDWVDGDQTSTESQLILVFSNANSSIIKSITASKNIQARVLAVGGGGAGGTVRSSSQTGHPGGGGGGAGELVDRSDVSFDGETTYSIVIGEGGQPQGSSTDAKPGGNGGESSITSEAGDLIRVKGGGGGGGESVGQPGGSGGGGSNESADGGDAVKNETDGQVNAGGVSGRRYAAGGGGAGGVGGSGSTGTSGGTGGNGGEGVESDIDPKHIRYYAAGGGGGNTAAGNGGTGGQGGGGNGGKNTNTGAVGEDPTSGENGTGSGGGGGGRYKLGAAGGSGIIIIRITWIKQEMQWADPFPITANGYTGTIQLDRNATTNWVDGDLVITYTDAVMGGGLKFSTGATDGQHKIWANARVLVVGGGGGGGFVNDRTGGGGAGGGAGGLIETNNLVFCSDTEYEISIGAGGAAGTSEVGKEAGDDGKSSSVRGKDEKINLEAKGGGGGGAKSAGKEGGSGGGGSQFADAADGYRDGGKGAIGQGFAGGAGGTSTTPGLAVGAGGGGAGGKGEDAETASNHGGNGGAGKASNISGATQEYAGGGGGSYVNNTSTTYLGGTASHGGGAGAGRNAAGVIMAQDGTDGTGGGGGGGTGLADDTNPAGRGGSGIVIIRLSGFVVRGLPEPEPSTTKFTYNDEEQTVITPSSCDWAYALTGTTSATNSDWYSYSVSIRDELTCNWLSGGREPKMYSWAITPLEVELPKILPQFAMNNPNPEKFDNAKKTSVAIWAEQNWETNGVVTATSQYWMGLEVGDHTNRFWYCTLKDYQQTNAGETNLTATLRTTGPGGEANTTNFVWKTTPRTEPRTVDWQIGQADNEITSFTIANIQFNAGKTVSPTTTWKWQTISSDKVVYTYFKGETKPTDDDAYDLEEAPTEAGVYWAHAYICKDSKHEPGNWGDAHEYTRFAIWKHPSTTLTDFVNIKVDNSNGKSLADFPVLVRISPDLIKGFTYDRAGSDGSALRFIQMKSDGDYLKPDAGNGKRSSVSTDELLPYEIEKWDPYGESLVWVKINPTAITTSTAKGLFRMYWHKNGTEEFLADLLPEQVWSQYTGVWHFNVFDTFDTTEKSQASSPNATTAEGIDAHIAQTSGTLTNQEGILGMGVQTAEDANGAGIWMKDPGQDSPLDGGSKFVISGWFKHYGAEYSWDHIFYKRSRAVNDNEKEYANPYYDAFAIEVNDASFKIDARGSSKTTTTQTPTVDPNGKWVQLAFVYNGTSCSIYENGALVKAFSITSCKDNDAPLAVGNNSNYEVDGIIDSPWRGLVDEVRFTKGTKDAAWVKAEYETIANTNFCSFGLVNRPVKDGEDAREWIDFWTTEPSLKHYWTAGELTTTKITNGKGEFRSAVLSYDTSRNIAYFGRTMPSGEAWANGGQTVPTEKGVYTVEYLHAQDKDQYGQLWAYFDGTRLFDIEIVGSDPQPDLGGTATGRVLLANDDTNAVAAVTGQSYFSANENSLAWWTHSTELPDDLKVFNIWPGTDHTFFTSNAETQVATPLWKLTNVYFGNLMMTNIAESAVISNAFNTLPRSTTSLNSFKSDDYEAPFDWHQAGHLIMQNSSEAKIESGWYTNGIGTIYFDAVNADAVDPITNNLKLVVQVNLSETDDDAWGEFCELHIMRCSNSAVTFVETNDVLSCLDVNNGGHTDGKIFYRVYAKVNETRPCRFRICRWGDVIPGEGEEGINANNPKGFIVLDNIIASFAPPVPTFETYGMYDPTRTGRAVLGTETAFTIDYPAVGDTNIYGRARLVAGDTNAVTSARLRYRWRYLNGLMDPTQVTGRETWKMVLLEQYQGTDEYRTTEPLAHRAMPGDIEYYFDVTATVPFYQYVDYTGKNLKIKESKSKDYSEDPRGDEPEKIRSEEQRYPSYGHDWFVRLRDFPSKTRGYKILSKTSLEETTVITNEMDFIDRGLWRGFVRTFDDTNKTARAAATNIFFRFEREVPANPGAKDLTFYKTYLYSNDDSEFLPNTLTVTETSEIAATNYWTKIPRDGTTGYVMFQLSEDENGTPGQLSIVHADYQNFNTWDDAHSADGCFVGNSTENETKTGVSEKKREYVEDFSRWTDTSATNGAWHETFTEGSGQFSTGHEMYKMFPTIQTPNGWTANQGMWVHEKYKVDGSSAAFQMKGSGEGSIEVFELTPKLRGLESITLSTRLAQFLEWDDIAWDDVGRRQAAMMTNYTFVTQFAMSPNDWAKDTNEQFDGAGSVSVFAFFNDQEGAYEFRLTRTAELGMRMQLFKWTSSSGQMIAQPLGHSQPYDSTAGEKNESVTADNAPFRSKSNQYALLYISCARQLDGSVQIQGGVSNGRANAGAMTKTNDKPYSISYWDTKSPLKPGTYGLASANCPAVFVQPRVIDTSAQWLGGTTKDSPKYNKDSTVTFGTPVSCEGFEWWVQRDGRIKATETGFEADWINQKLLIQWKPSAAGKDANWTNLVTHTVSGFMMSKVKTYTFNRVEDGVYRFSHGASVDDGRGDIVIDNIELRQWRGTDTGNNDAKTWIDEYDRDYAWRSNFVFTSGWIEKNRVKLSAKRTTVGYPSSIRTPLLNGNTSTDCGIGLGMISIEYADAQENVNLLVQVITNNVTDVTPKNNWLEEEGQWVTITNFDFSAVSPLERRNGVLDVYLGLHGVKGVMRVVLDPAVVRAVKDEEDSKKFGEIYIKKIYCRDEPEITDSSWWGWNLRTIGFDQSSRWDNGYRTYLPDYAVSGGASGLSLALNNSIKDDVRPGEDETYKQHVPFVQTPTLRSQVGEVTFRARLFSLDEKSKAAEVTIYGSEDGNPDKKDSEWTKLQTIEVTNTVYETYHFRAPSSAYRAFRLGVTGVPGVIGQTPSDPVRVLLDEIAVSEALYPKLGFKYVYPVRTGLTDNTVSPCFANGEPLADEQPLVGENWTIQAEVEVKQLGEELDLDTPGHEPRVFFYHYDSMLPWGFTKWSGLAEPIELQPAMGTNGEEKLIFRGSFSKAPNAIMEAALNDGDVVQFMAQVVYWDKSGSAHTNEVENGTSGGWTTPKWYNPIDYNKNQSSFSPFVIFETIAPHRVWINEVNLFDAVAKNENNQYIEIAAPIDQPIEGWSIQYINNSLTQTNTIAIFSSASGRLPPTKKTNETNDYVFIAIQSPATQKAKTWENVTRPSGEKVVMDGTWSDFDRNGGSLTDDDWIALRLVRPSGIVEQQVVGVGTNWWLGTRYADEHSAEEYLKKLNGSNVRSEWPNYYLIGDEHGNEPVTGLQGRSLGVYRNVGLQTGDWNNTMHQTPGWCNEGQIIPEGWVLLPNGEMVVVTAKIEGDHIRHRFGDRTNTNERFQFTVPKGSEGTNIIYTIDNYYEIASVTTNGTPVSEAPGEKGEYTLRVAKGVSNNVTVVARAQVWDDLETKYGLAKDSRYRAAILDWLEKGKTLRGEFANPGEIHLGEYHDLAGNFITNLSLVVSYWLDMDPTESDWWFKAGITQAPDPKYHYKPAETKKLALKSGIVGPTEPEYEEVENFRIKVKMLMTNLTSHVSYSPYVLRGREVGLTSLDYNAGTNRDWTAWNSASFKITGDLQNGLPMRQHWVPLRQFYFLPDSFDENYEALIEIWDPFDPTHPGWEVGWERYTDCPAYYSWALDENNRPKTVEPLKADSTFPTETP